MRRFPALAVLLASLSLAGCGGPAISRERAVELAFDEGLRALPGVTAVEQPRDPVAQLMRIDEYYERQDGQVVPGANTAVWVVEVEGVSRVEARAPDGARPAYHYAVVLIDAATGEVRHIERANEPVLARTGGAALDVLPTPTAHVAISSSLLEGSIDDGADPAGYNDRPVEVFGVVTALGAHSGGGPMITLEGSSELGVDCIAPSGAGLATVVVGEQISVRGTVTGPPGVAVVDCVVAKTAAGRLVGREPIGVLGPPRRSHVPNDSGASPTAMPKAPLRAPIPTPTPTPMPPSVGVHAPADVRAQFERWPDAYKFPVDEDMVVPFAYPWSMGHRGGSVSIIHIPSVSSALFSHRIVVDSSGPTPQPVFEPRWGINAATDEGRRALDVALADAALMARIEARREALGSAGYQSREDMERKAVVALYAEPVPEGSLTVRFVGEVVGGPDNNPELYCAGTGWQFGQGEQSFFTTAMCIPWWPEVEIQRRFETPHTYLRPGSYEVTCTIGPLQASMMLEVR